MGKQMYQSIQQWMSANNISAEKFKEDFDFKDLKQLLFQVWRDRQIEVDFWKRKYKNLEQGYNKARKDMKILQKRMGIK